MLSELQCFCFFAKFLRALNSEVVQFLGGSRTLEKFWHEVSALSKSLAVSKDIFSLHKSSRGIITQKVVKILSIQSIHSLLKN